MKDKTIIRPITDAIQDVLRMFPAVRGTACWGIAPLLMVGSQGAFAGLFVDAYALEGARVQGVTEELYFGHVGGVGTLNNSGQVASSLGFTDAAGTSIKSAVVVGTPKNLEFRYWQGDPVPLAVGDGVSSESNHPKFLFDDGGLVLETRLSGAGIHQFGDYPFYDVSITNDTVVWTDRGGAAEPIYQYLDPAPGLPGVQLQRHKFGSMAAYGAQDGTVFFESSLGGDGIDESNNSVLWRSNGGQTEIVWREGQQAPGLPEGTVAYRDPPDVAWNASGQYVMKALLEKPDGSFGSAVWKDVGNGLELVLAERLPAPGEPGRFVGPSLGNIHIDALGNVLIEGSTRATAEGFGGTSPRTWSDRDGSLAPIYEAGMVVPVPEFSPTTNYPTESVLKYTSGYAVADDGTLAFVGQVENYVPGYSRTGLWQSGVYREADQGLEVVAWAGQVAPGLGKKFDGFGDLWVNGDGQMVFHAGLVDGVSSNRESLWAATGLGDIELLVAIGEPLKVAPGVFKTVSGFSYRSPDARVHGRPYGYGDKALNDNGQFIFSAEFTDGTSGLFLASIVEQTTASANATEDSVQIQLVQQTGETSVGDLVIGLDQADVTAAGDFAVTHNTVTEVASNVRYENTPGWEDVQAGFGVYLGDGKQEFWSIEHGDFDWDGFLELSFVYDDQYIDPAKEAELGIWHFGTYGEDGSRIWRFYDSFGDYSEFFSIDPVANLMTVRVDNLSDFLVAGGPGNGPVGSAPLPSTLLLVLMGWMGGGGVLRWRRHHFTGSAAVRPSLHKCQQQVGKAIPAQRAGLFQG